MNMLYNLMKNDLLLFHRNRIIVISAIVTLIYMAIFRLLEDGMYKEKLLILIIFNDPALLGFLFIGVMVLFEKDESTLAALSVTPVNASRYVLSKSISLTIISSICSLIMAISSKGLDFKIHHFIVATFFTSMNFSFIGFIAVAGAKGFNSYFVKAIGIIMLMTLPFLTYFELTPDYLFVLFPTWNSLKMYGHAFSEESGMYKLLLDYGLAIVWLLILYRLAIGKMGKELKV